MRWTQLPEFAECPSDWEVTPLLSKANFIAGQSPPSASHNDTGEGVPFLQGNADFGRTNPKPVVYSTEPTKLCDIGDTLISVRAPVGVLNRADQVYGLGRGVGALHPNDVDSDYLFHAMSRWRLPLSRAAQGSTFDAVTGRHFRQLLACLPRNKKEQQAIAQRLDLADEAITAAEVKLTAAQRLKTALMQQLFTRGLPGKHTRFVQTKLGSIPEDWELGSLVAHCGTPACVKTGPFGAQLPPEAFSQTGIRMVNITDIGEAELAFTSEFYVLPDVFERLRDYSLIEGDVIFSRVASVGRLAAIEKTHEPLLMSSNCIRLRPGPIFNSKFLTHVFLNAESVKRRSDVERRRAADRYATILKAYAHSATAAQ
jgi:type I restriction enzyme, S subunit